MATDERISIEPDRIKPLRDKTRQTRLVLGAAAAILALIVAIGAITVLGGEDVAVEPEVAVALSYYEALNNGDVDGWLATLTAERAQTELLESGDVILQSLANANREIEVVEPCRLIAPSFTGVARVQCTVTERDDFSGAGELRFSYTDTFVVDENGQIVSVDGDFDFTVAQEFLVAFWDWLEVAHSDIYAELAPRDHESLPGLRDRHPDDMLLALDYVDEFVAQSDKYPISR